MATFIIIERLNGIHTIIRSELASLMDNPLTEHEQIINELFDEVKKLKEELEVTEKILAERQRVLDAIPECPSHGSCVPHAIEWIEEMKLNNLKLKPRFKPNQEAWTPYENRALRVDVMEIIWSEDLIEYEIQTMSELGHQAFEVYYDKNDEKCLLFSSKEDCEKFMNLI